MKRSRQRNPSTDGLDARTMAELERAGADLSRTRETIHYLYLPTQQAAEQAARQLTRPDRETRVDEAPGEDSWLVVLVQHMVVSEQTIRGLRAEIEAVVGALDGDYDGWEAAVDADPAEGASGESNTGKRRDDA